MKRRIIAVDEKDFQKATGCLASNDISFDSYKSAYEMFVYETCIFAVTTILYGDSSFDDIPDESKDDVIRRIDEGGIYKKLMDIISDDEDGEYISGENIMSKVSEIMKEG